MGKTLVAAHCRTQAATVKVTEALQKAKQCKDKIKRDLEGPRFAEKKQALFAKYDKDGDGLLNIDDVAAYAKGEVNFEIPADSKDRINKQLFKSGDRKLGVE